MTRVLVAGIGNVFLGDDGFGVEVVRRLATAPPPGIELYDAGIRGLHLAYRLLDGYDLLIAIDLVSRGGEPGTLYVVEPTLTDGADDPRPPDAHAIDLASVLATAKSMGAALGRVLVVGCEPESLEERMGLSTKVAAAVEPAAARVRQIAMTEGGSP